MSNTNKYRNRLISLLKELFQLDKPELDFGLYKIMHAKSVQISRFLENDLLKEIQQAFGEKDQVDASQLKANATEKLKAALGEEALDERGQLNPIYANTPAGKAYLQQIAAAEAAKDTLNAEAEVYDHLYRFFERYYDSGDFMSRRYYARESDSRAAPYAVPYDGREVYLHWANKDQYYIKSSEYLTNYTFELNAAIVQEAERQKRENKNAALDLGGTISDKPQKVHFRIVSASEGEHGNIKAGNDQKRFFIIHADEPVKIENGELIIQFQYRNDPEKSGQDKTWQESLLNQAEARIDEALQALPEGSGLIHGLKLPAPTDSKKDRTLLGKHLQKYSNRNTMDYFIHKDLGSFLRRELDFYIKNEIMRLDDIENAEAPKVEQYIGKIKVLRRIAHQLIAFLAQLENFQKKLWLKKKFVTETQYCITLDRIPENFYPEIAANDKQREEWDKLFAIDEIKGDLATPGYSVPLTVDFLKANPFLLIDTGLFDESFKTRILNDIQGLDHQCDGLLIDSENFHALSLLRQRYAEQVKCIYIDPPYNTGDDGFLYKDGYKDSSWAAMQADRFLSARELISPDGAIFCSIDDGQYRNLWHLMAGAFLFENYVGSYVWKRRSSSGLASTPLSLDHEYILTFAKSINQLRLSGLEKTAESYPYWDATVQKHYASTDLTIGATREQRPNQFFPIENPRTGATFEANPHRVWRFFPETMRKVIAADLIIWPDEAEGNMERPRYKTYFNPEDMLTKPCSSWIETSSVNDREIAAEENDYDIAILSSGMNQEGGRALQKIIGSKSFAYPKPVSLVRSITRTATVSDSIALDYFSGSGTTGHSVISLNREDQGKRKYILIEMGEYFGTILKPRISKVIHSDGWRDGKPTARQAGISHCFKYIHLV